MNKYLEIEKLLFRYDKYGTELTDNGTILIGHPNYLPKLWWLIQLYPKGFRERMRYANSASI